MQAKRLDATSTGQYPLDKIVTGSVRGKPDVGVLASADEAGDTLAIMMWNYHDDALAKPDAQIMFNVTNAFPGAKEVQLTHYRIDDSHSNAYAMWQAMGSPQQPTIEAYKDLLQAGMLAMLYPPTAVNVENGKIGLSFDLPIHAVSLLVLEK